MIAALMVSLFFFLVVSPLGIVSLENVPGFFGPPFAEVVDVANVTTPTPMHNASKILFMVKLILKLK